MNSKTRIRASAAGFLATVAGAVLFILVLPGAATSSSGSPALARASLDAVAAGWNVSMFSAATIGSAPPAGSSGVGAFDPSGAIWHLRTRGGDPAVFTFGASGNVPLVGDWNNDGVDTIGVFDPATGSVKLRNTNTAGSADTTFSIGDGTDIPFAGDFNGDGSDSVGVFDPVTATVYIFNATTPGATFALGDADDMYSFGAAGNTPLAGDFNNDGTDTLAFYDPTTSVLSFRGANTGGIPSNFTFTAPVGLPIVGDWYAPGTPTPGVETPGVFVPASAAVHLRNTNTAGGSDESYTWGMSGWLPVAGDFGTLSSGVTVTVSGAPQGLAWALESLYLEYPSSPYLPDGLRTRLAGLSDQGQTLTVSGASSTADAYGSGVSVVTTAAGDTVLAVLNDDLWTWRIVGAHLVSEGKTRWFGDGPRFVTIYGTDVRDGTAAPGQDPAFNNADSVHIYSVVPEIGTGAIVGISRDTVLDYTGPGSFNGQQELHWTNFNGPDVTNAVISANTGIPLEGYFLTGFGTLVGQSTTPGFTDIINVMGGIDPFYVPYSVASQCAQNPPPPIATVGDTTLTPQAALAFSRERKCTATGPDGKAIGVNGNSPRTLSQGLLMKAVIDDLQQTTGIIALPTLLNTMESYVQTNLSPDDLLTIAASIFIVDTGTMPTLTETDIATNGIGAYDLNAGTLPNVIVAGCVGTFVWTSDTSQPPRYAQYFQPPNMAVWADLADGVLNILPVPKFDSGSWTKPTFCPWVPGINHFPDVTADKWYFKYVESIWGNGITEGFPDGTFKPEKNVPRSEMAAFMVRSAGQTENILTGPPGPFPDVAWDAWYGGWVDKLVQLNIAEGFPDGTYKPNRDLTRGETAALIVRALGFPNPPIPTVDPFTDVPKNAWYGRWVAKLKELGITTGYPDGTYRPLNTVTRAEFATVLDRSFL